MLPVAGACHGSSNNLKMSEVRTALYVMHSCMQSSAWMQTHAHALMTAPGVAQNGLRGRSDGYMSV